MIKKRWIGMFIAGLLLFSSCADYSVTSQENSEISMSEVSFVSSSDETQIEQSNNNTEYSRDERLDEEISQENSEISMSESSFASSLDETQMEQYENSASDSSDEPLDKETSMEIFQTTYYQCQLEYAIIPIKGEEESSKNSQYGVYGAYGQHVLDNMVRLLSSDFFTEYLIEGLEGVPVRLDQNGEISVAYNTFRQTQLYIDLVEKVKAAVVFSFKVVSENSQFAYSSIFVDLNVQEDKAFAEILLSNTKKAVPNYIECNMAIPNGYIGTSCQLLTQNSELNELKK